MWFKRIVKTARGDLTTNPQGLDDGGLNLSGGLFGLMSNPPTKRKRSVHKKINNPLERPGEASEKMQ